MTSKKDKDMKELFGDDDSSDDEDTIIKGTTTVTPASLKKSTDVPSGLFGSDSSSSDEESDTPKPKKKKGKRRAGKLKGSSTSKKRKPSSSTTTTTTNAAVKNDSGDEYDSGGEVEQTKEDEDFIDAEDDLADVLGEYNADGGQKFQDERPVGRDDIDELQDRMMDQNEDNFFDQTLNSLKSSRKKKTLDLSPAELESMVQEILFRMDTAATNDETAMAEKKPAFEKLKLLDFAVGVLQKVQLQATLLDFNVLEVLKKWIQPLPSGSLPNVGIRTKILNVSRRLPVYKDHLKRSGYGKVVMSLWKHPDETEENKDVCRELIERWSRNVFEKSVDYRKLEELEAEKEESMSSSNRRRRNSAAASRRASSASVSSVTNNNLAGRIAATTEKADLGVRVRIPQPMALDFVHRPAPRVWKSNDKTSDSSQYSNAIAVANRLTKKINPDSKKGNLVKRMQNVARPSRKNTRAVSMSVEGRGK